MNTLIKAGLIVVAAVGVVFTASVLKERFYDAADDATADTTPAEDTTEAVEATPAVEAEPVVAE
jgi:hypothetical protein